MRYALGILMLCTWLAYVLFFVNPSTAASQSVAGPLPGPKSMPPSGPPNTEGNLQGAIDEVLRQEAQQPTNAGSVSSRYGLLSDIARGLLQTGNITLLNIVMSNERRLRIEALLQGGDANAAALLVTQSIQALNTAAASGHGVWSTPQISGSLAGYPPAQGGKAGHSPAQSGGERQVFTPKPQTQRVLPICDTAALDHGDKPLQRWAIHTLATGLPFPPVNKLGMPALDATRRKLYVTGTQSTHLAIINLDTDTVERTVDIGVTGGYLLLDKARGDVYLFQIGRQFYKLDLAQGRATPIDQLPPAVRMPPPEERVRYKDRLFFETGYPFQRGYMPREKASYGVIRVLDAATEKEVAQIKHGPDALYFAIDQTTGKLYASNTGDSSITVYDCNDNYKLLKYIDVGTTIEGITLVPTDNSLFLRNRLGGSEIYVINPQTGVLKTLRNGDRIKDGGISLWPMSIEPYRDGVYSLGHFEGKIDVVNIGSKEVLHSIPLSLPDKPRTEGLSSLVIDRQRGMLFAALPELGLIAVIDAAQQRQIATIAITGMAEAECKGPHCMMLAASDVTGSLFVYLPWKHSLQVYSSSDYSLLKSIDLSTTDEWLTTLCLSDAWGLLAVGNTLLSLDTLATVVTLDAHDYIVAMDAQGQRIYVRRGCRDAQDRYRDTLFEYTKGQVSRSWALEPVPAGIPCSFAFDFSRQRFYVGYFETAILEEYSLE